MYYKFSITICLLKCQKILLFLYTRVASFCFLKGQTFPQLKLSLFLFILLFLATFFLKNAMSENTEISRIGLNHLDR